MRSEVLKTGRLRFARTVALVALTALGAGCSADATRFDSFYTGAVPQPQRPVPQGGIDQTSTGSVGQNARQPLYDGSSGSLPPASQDYGQNYPQGGNQGGSIQRATLAPPSAPSAVTASAAQPRPYTPPAAAMEQPAPVRAASAAPAKAGWSASGNTVTLREGETLDTISNRYGVPVKALMSANGLTSASDAVAGRQIAIPTYSYGERPAARAVADAGGAQQLGAPPQTLRAPSASRSVAAATPGHVIVESGDSLMGIARRSGVTVAELKAANGMTGDSVRIGQKLTLPGGAMEPKRVASLDPREGMASKPAVKPAAKAVAETAEKQPKPYQAPAVQKPAEEKAAAKAPATETKPAAQPKVVASAASAKEETVAAAPVKEAAPATTIADEETKEAAAAPSSTGIDQFRWPVQGRVLKRFGDKDGTRRNDGLDISVPRGTPVKAAENGVVIYAGDGLKEFGNTVLVRHDNGLVTVYGHADDLKVKRGETVKRGQEIATAGMSGDAQAPMLHFEVRKNSAPVDPGKYLQ
ncbi:peptidoglycan DD-metalloendopeptidase family protein [Aureimonas leprariae]|uniref:Peptidoglycan DD-metalloendopeptidase family protein n=1 Tax=Plantimonas leprariae TaxID=2615207 RepID=A0A7V7PSC1_9HYPH|nr:peptidoglycan DD-metalloendopeptidase family protein [Aureimonas leprariae]KAB0681980.1 peptidoglycan DD-metalloendopeptidase family protein [Aureimonas leprariae]